MSTTKQRQMLLDLAFVVENGYECEEFHIPQFEMSTFGKSTYCGTVACIAGTAVWLWDHSTFEQCVDFYPRQIHNTAESVLGLTHGQSQALFLPVQMREIKRHHAAAMLRWFADHPNADCWAIDDHWRTLMMSLPRNPPERSEALSEPPAAELPPVKLRLPLPRTDDALPGPEPLAIADFST